MSSVTFKNGVFFTAGKEKMVDNIDGGSFKFIHSYTGEI